MYLYYPISSKAQNMLFEYSNTQNMLFKHPRESVTRSLRALLEYSNNMFRMFGEHAQGCRLCSEDRHEFVNIV